MSARIPLQHGFEPLEIAVLDKGIAPVRLFAAAVQRRDDIAPFFAVDGVSAQINRRAEDGSDGALGIALVRVVLVRGFGFAAIPALKKQPAPSKTPPDYQSCRFILSNCRLSRLVGRPSG